MSRSNSSIDAASMGIDDLESGSSATASTPDFHTVRLRAHRLLSGFGVESDSEPEEYDDGRFSVDGNDDGDVAVGLALRAVDSLLENGSVYDEEECGDGESKSSRFIGNIVTSPSFINSNEASAAREEITMDRDVYDLMDGYDRRISDLSVGSAYTSASEMSCEQQSAMDQFLSNPNDMNWEDLVKTMKEEKRSRRRSSTSSVGSNGSRSGRGRTGRRNKTVKRIEKFTLDLSTIVDDAISKNIRTLVLDNDEEAIDFDANKSVAEGVHREDSLSVIMKSGSRPKRCAAWEADKIRAQRSGYTSHSPMKRMCAFTLAMCGVFAFVAVAAGRGSSASGQTWGHMAAPLQQVQPGDGAGEVMVPTTTEASEASELKELESEVEELENEIKKLEKDEPTPGNLQASPAQEESSQADAAKLPSQDKSSPAAPVPQIKVQEDAPATPQDGEASDLSNFCDTCQWNHAPFDCKTRVEWEMERFHKSEDEAKRANLLVCSRARTGK